MSDAKNTDSASIMDEFETASTYSSWGEKAKKIRRGATGYAKDNPENKHLPLISERAAELEKAIKDALREVGTLALW